MFLIWGFSQVDEMQELLKLRNLKSGFVVYFIKVTDWLKIVYYIIN
jgi:hypothetical protein